MALTSVIRNTFNGGIDALHNTYTTSGDDIAASISTPADTFFWLNPGDHGRIERITIIWRAIATTSSNSCNIFFKSAMHDETILAAVPNIITGATVTTTNAYYTYYADASGNVSATLGTPIWAPAMFSSAYLAFGLLNNGNTSTNYNFATRIEYA
jgi:hypothetical protein